jgi:hypothetical protein
VVNDTNLKKDGGDEYDCSAEGSGLDDVDNFVFASGKPPGIVESTKKEDLVPYPEKTEK